MIFPLALSCSQTHSVLLCLVAGDVARPLPPCAARTDRVAAMRNAAAGSPSYRPCLTQTFLGCQLVSFSGLSRAEPPKSPS